MPGYGQVWYHPGGIANILSLARVKDKYRVTYDSTKGNQFQVHKADGSVRIFKESKKGLYYMEVGYKTKGTVLVMTVEDKKNSYTDRDYSRAVLACKLHNIIGRPSLRDYLQLV